MDRSTIDPPGIRSEAAASVRLDEALFELELSRELVRRLELDVRRLEQRLAQLEADRLVVAQRLEERERYLAAILRSTAWKLIQKLRGLFGRRW